MDLKVEEQPLEKRYRKSSFKKQEKRYHKSSPSLSSLPDEILLNCLARVWMTQYHSLSLVSKSFYSLLSSPDIYAVRSELGVTESRVYVCMLSPNDRSWFTLLKTYQGELTLVPVKLSTSCPPARLTTITTVTVGSEIYQFGGTIRQKRRKDMNKNKAVLVFDCRTNKWRRGPNLIVGRNNAKSCFLDGKIYVTGGCKKKYIPMKWGEVFDLKSQTWNPLPSPRDDGVDPIHKVAVFGGRLHVMTRKKNYAYDTKEERWVVPEVDFVGLGPIRCITQTSCVIVIDNIMFGIQFGKVKWYNPKDGNWYIVSGLHDDCLLKRATCKMMQVVNKGRKLVIIWQQEDWMENYKTFGCALIRLEKQPNHKFRGEVEQCNVVLTVPSSHNLLSCLSLSV